MYAYSLYFAVMTITSVGYGDVVATAFNPFEQVLCSFIMLLSGMIWGYLIGTFCGLAASLSPVVKSFREDLSSLNYFMRQHHLPSETRVRMREYFHQTIHLRHVDIQPAAREALPCVQAEVSFIVNARWIDQVWYLRTSTLRELQTTRCASSSPRASPRLSSHPASLRPWDSCTSSSAAQLCGGKMLRETQNTRSVWGDDVILQTPTLQLTFPALAATTSRSLRSTAPTCSQSSKSSPR